MKRLFLAYFFLMFLCIGCSTSEKPQSQNTAQAAAAPTTVSTVAVASHKLNKIVSLPAQLVPYESVDIYPKVTGFVQEVSVDRGSNVRRGQVLVRITAPELASHTSQAEAAVKSSRIATCNRAGKTRFG